MYIWIMGTLKKLKRQSKADVSRIAELIKNVNDLVAMGLLQMEFGAPDIYIYPEIWAGKSATFKKNWCQNVFRVWCLNSGKTPEETRTLTMAVFHKENGDLLATYTEKGGFVGQ